MLKDSAVGTTAVVAAFAGLSIGSTLAKSTGEPGPLVACWRFVIAAVIWHLAVAVRRRRRPATAAGLRSAARLATLPGALFGINLSLFFSGAARTPIAHAEFISALTPVVMVPLAARLTRRRVERAVVALGGVAVAGIALILAGAPGGGTSLSGDLLVVGAMATWIVYLLVAQAARREVPTTEFMAVMSTAAAVVTVPVALVTVGGPAEAASLSPGTWARVATMAVVSAVAAHGLIAWAQRRVAAGTISLLQLTQPALGVLWAAAFLGEPARPPQLAGMAIVLLAVGAIARRAAAAPPPGPAPGQVIRPKPTRNASVTAVS